MGFDRDYPNRKDWRRPYLGAKAVCASCRNHGTCDHCRGDRLHAAIRRAPAPDPPDPPFRARRLG